MRAHEAGYTLIELTVALLLLSFVALLVSGGVQFGTRVWERSEDSIATADAVDNAQTILRSILSSATPNVSDGFASFDGGADRATFDGPAPAAFGSGGLVRFILSLEHDTGGGTTLALSMHSLLDKTRTRDANIAVVPGQLTLSYLDASGRVPQWLAVWRNRDRLPDAVRIEAVADTAAASWPSLVVHLPIAQDATCVFDPVSVSCRRS